MNPLISEPPVEEPKADVVVRDGTLHDHRPTPVGTARSSAGPELALEDDE